MDYSLCGGGFCCDRSDSIGQQRETMFELDSKAKRTRFFARWSPIATLLALLALASQVPSASCQAPTPPASQTVDLSVTADEVALDLVVHDKKNKPVLNLKQDEIAITDGGSPVTINSFRLVNGAKTNERLITLVFDRPRPVTGTKLESDPSMMKNAREAAEKIFKMVPEGGFSFSVLTVEGRLRLQSAFTSDRNALAQAVNSATQPVTAWDTSPANPLEKQLVSAALTGIDASGKAVGAHDRALDKTMLAALTDSGKIVQDQHLRPFLAGLLALTRSQQQIRQRKALIFFTSFDEEKIDLRTKEAIQSIIGSANQAGESIYIIDLNSSDRKTSQMNQTSAAVAGVALGGPAAAGIDGLTSAQGQINKLGMNGYAQLIETERNNDDMRSLAVGTGGSYITRDRLQKSLDQMIEDMTTYYVASYVPPIKDYDGKFRPITVKPLRGGLKIRSQSGYLALPPQTGSDAPPQPFELPLLKILGETQLPADVIFRAAILRMGATPDGTMSTLAIEAPYSNLEIRDDSSTGLHTASLSIVADIKDKTGVIIERFSADIPRSRIQKDSDKSDFGAISFQRHFLAPPGQYILEAAVLDRYSGKAGAQRVAFEIPGAADVPSLSNMVLVRQTAPLRADDDSTEPLRHGNQLLTPNLSGQLAPGAKDVSVFFNAHSDPHATEAATVKLQVYRDGKLLGGEPMTSRQASGSEFASFLSSFSVNPPVDGLYEVKAILSQGGKSIETGTSFTLTGGQPADDTQIASVANSPVPAHSSGPLSITIPVNPIQRPSTDELKSILADATHYAMDYGASLPNFMCEQVTNRSVDLIYLDGTNGWHHKDKFTELLTYFNHEENRMMLELVQNGSTSHQYTEDTRGAMSVGEFGVTLSGLFRPSSKADFQWKETAALGDGTVQVFDYRVRAENSTFNLRTGSNDVITVGYHGQVYIDTVTRMVRRITQVTDNVPAKFLIREASVSVDYDYVVLNNHDYMLPIGAQVILKKGRRELDLNEIEFRNFRRFGSRAF
jgi:VWFA-related protein